ncbi:MAG: hypothetical protein ACFFB0_21630 [Promethearchaeota archaeon]
MMNAKDFSIKKKILIEHLAELFLELRYVKIHCERCYGTKIYTKLKKPRTLIRVNELESYIDYKAKELSGEEKIDLKLDHAVKVWIKKAINSGIHSISFDKEEASDNTNITYFYELFSQDLIFENK